MTDFSLVHGSSDNDGSTSVAATLAARMFAESVNGCLTAIDELALADAGSGAAEFAWEAYLASTPARRLVWVDLGGVGVGHGVAENVGSPSPHYTYIADEDPDFGDLWCYDDDALPFRLHQFGTPSLPRLTQTLNRTRVGREDVLVLAELWDARPYHQILSRQDSIPDKKVRSTAQDAVYSWMADDLATFAALRPDGPTVVISGRDDEGWSQLRSRVRIVLRRPGLHAV